MSTRRAEHVIIYFGHGNSGGFGFWWDRVVVSLISSTASFMVYAGLLQLYR